MHNLLLLSDTMTHQVKGSYLKLLIGKERHQYQKLIRTKLISKDIFEIDEQQWYNCNILSEILQEIDDDFGNTLIHKIGYEFASNLAFCSESAHLEEALTEVLKFLGKYHRSENTQDNLLRYFYSQSQEALIETKLPYPQTFIQGFLLSIVKKYQPRFAIKTKVMLLNEQNSSSILKNNYLYQINWTMV